MINNLLNKLKKSNNKLSKKIVFIGLIFLFLGLFLIESKTNILTTAIRGNNPTEEIRKVTIASSDYPNPGSYSIDKSAKWIGANIAEVEFDVSTKMKIVDGNYKDIILIMDISGSMIGEKMKKAKQDAIELATYILSDSHNKVALISFDTSSTIVSNFTNDLTTIETGINNLPVTGTTNYNAGLTNVFTVMENYQKESNRDLITLFLTDGYPNVDTPNQKGTYRALKELYPYMAINGIQYEMGNDIIQEVIDISDNQWIADKDTLNNVLFDATIAPLVYEEFTIEDYIDNDYFELASVNDDIEVSIGTVTLDNSGANQKIIWTIENYLMTGATAKLTMKLNLKSAYQNNEGLYATNKSETIKMKLPEEELKVQDSDKTPILKNTYKISYDSNSPDSNCTLPTYQDETHFIYQTVEKKDTELTCEGYLFKGWEIDEIDDKDITHLNDDYFLMPSHDIKIRALWASLRISKKMDGTVHEKMTLYKVLEDAATVGTYAKEYTGSHQDSMDVSLSTKKIYYWWADNDTNGTAILDKNNVIFGGFCWQMIRTTDTGGVKLIYNGEPLNGQCLNTRSDHKGTVGTSGSAKDLNEAYIYSDTYEYDTTNNTFTLKDNLNTVTWSDSTYRNLLGKYTCASASNTCTTLYQVNAYQNSTTAYTTSYTIENTHYSQIGTSPFNAKGSSPATVGYMYNDVYKYDYKSRSTEVMLIGYQLNTRYWYSHGVVWGSPTANKYNLDNPYQVSSTSDYPNLVGEYSFMNISQTYTSSNVSYIAAVDNTTMYYIQLGDETGTTHDLSYYNYTYTYGDSYTDNGDGTYTINNPTAINRSDWYTSYSNLRRKYVCKNAVNNTCSELWYTTSTTKNYMYYIKPTNTYKYAKSFTWDGSKYILDNATSVSFWNISDSTNKTSLNNAHYTCWNETGECTTISYIYYIDSDNTIYYINITGGKSVEDALNKMLSDNNVNLYNSTIKGNIDAWYEKYMLPYESYLEDTIFCNDRSIRNLGGWNPDGGDLTTVYLRFMGSISTTDLSCTNITDRFSVSNNNAKLKYKVGLITKPEISLLNNSKIRATGQKYWTESPYNFANNLSNVNLTSTSGNLNEYNVSYADGVRPTISLVPGIEYISGDGSQGSPYIVDTTP